MTDDGRSTLALQVQRLDNAQQRVVVVGYALGLRNGDHRFTVAQLREFFDSLRVPAPKNISSTLDRLRVQQLALSRAGGGWSLTPAGEHHARALVRDVTTEGLLAELAALPGAELARVQHKLLPSVFAPPRWAPAISRLLDKHPFERNVFCMTRLPDETADPRDDPVGVAVERTRDVLNGHGLTLHLASDRQIDDDLLGNVGAYMWACAYGVGLLEDRVGRGLNYNAVIELGSMIVTGRRCVMLRDVTAPKLPSDLAGQIYKSVDFDDLTSVEAAIDAWVTVDLAIA